jgi:monoterpene epsilon-lactone hydrolase
MSATEREAVRAMLAAGPDLWSLSVPELRAAYEQFGALTPVPADIAFTPATLGGVPCEIGLAPGSDASLTVLYFHGGGYVIGSLQTHRGMVGLIGKAAKARTVAVDYRLAPEAPFPAAVEDAVAAYRGLLAEGTPAERIIVGGDSAGGGLTLALLMSLRDAGVALPRAAVCISPWLDLEGTGETVTLNAAKDLIVTAPAIAKLGGHYLGGASPRTPLAAPLHGELHGLPPLLVQVGSIEAVLDDSLRLARKVALVNGSLTLEVWPEVPHVWHLFSGMLSEGPAAIARIGAFIREQVA